MTAVQKLTRRLQDLPEEKREVIAAAILKEWDARDWDHQFAQDAQNGKLDFLFKELDEDLEAGRIQPL